MKSSTTKCAASCRTSTNYRSWKASLSLTSEYFYPRRRSRCLTGTVFFSFDRSVLRTNFYQLTKLALSFRMAPGFLPEVEYPKKPFGMFFVIGTLMFGRLLSLLIRTLGNVQEMTLEGSISASETWHVVGLGSSCQEIESMFLLQLSRSWYTNMGM
jgi:hypothetical protein